MRPVGWKTVLACVLLAACGTSGGDGPKQGFTGEARLRVALAAEGSGDRELAASMYSTAAAELPSDTAVQLRSAEGLARNGRVEEAAGLLRRRLRDDPRQAELLATLGSIEVLSGQPAQAETTLTEALAIRPDNIRALVNKGVALDLQKRHGEAQGLYRQALTLTPRDAAISNNLALSLLLSGHAAEAREALLPFRDDTTVPERVRINLGILEAAGGNGGEAQRLLAGNVSATDLAMLTHAIEAGGRAQ